MRGTVIFDIGKTNKKCVVFNEHYQEIYKEIAQFDEIKDDDGFPCDDLAAITQWIKITFQSIVQNPEFEIQAVNFSSYGASFVHIDQFGEAVTPLYNYLKPFPEDLKSDFHSQYGTPLSFATQTASPPLGMLNSGLQLYWLKHSKPQLFQKIKWSLHLPQYLSFLFTGLPISEYTSIGCHTGLWDFEKGDYHQWVYAEQIDRILPPIISSRISLNKACAGRDLKIGMGVHDSSAALLPYKNLSEDPFLVLSTGTWNIALNPFNQQALETVDLQQDCLNFMDVDGKTVKASRLFLGNEYGIWVNRLADFFGESLDKHQSMKVDFSIIHELSHYTKRCFHWESLSTNAPLPSPTNLAQFPNYAIAYHKLMQELVDLQTRQLKLAKGNSSIKKIFIDGGFAHNPLFKYFLQVAFPDLEFINTETPLGSATGAALLMN